MCVESWIEIAWLFITTLHWTVTNWSSLEACLRSVRWFKVRADLITLNHLEVIWSTEPICIIRYFSSDNNSNKQRSNETLVGAVIRTSDLQDRRQSCYQLSHAASHWRYIIIHMFLCKTSIFGLVMISKSLRSNTEPKISWGEIYQGLLNISAVISVPTEMNKSFLVDNQFQTKIF